MRTHHERKNRRVTTSGQTHEAGNISCFRRMIEKQVKGHGICESVRVEEDRTQVIPLMVD